jgi:nucleotide-binding universal stress UspA family protein
LFMKIVCGTDFSRHAAQAADAAAAIAARMNGVLVLVHAVEATGAGLDEDLQERLRAPAEERLREEAGRLRKSGVPVEEETIMGEPDEVIVDLAERANADLVVVSHLGRRVPERWLIGSVAERVAERSPVPTLVVRNAEPFRVWAREERSLKALAGTDFTVSSDAALRWLGQLPRCDVTALFLDWPTAEMGRQGLDGPELLTVTEHDVQRHIEHDLRHRLHRLLGDKEFRVLVRSSWGRVDSALCEAGRELEADLIVVGVHERVGLRRFWHSSISRGVVHSASTNVVFVPMAYGSAAQPAQPVSEIRRVLAVTDLSELGDDAVPYAYSVLKDGGEVRLFHVVEPLRTPNPLIGGHFEKLPTPKEHAAEIRHFAGHLRSLVPPDAEARQIKTNVEIIENEDPLRAICQAAERFDADLICLGSHGHSGLTEAILGSVAHGLLNHSRRPLLVIRPQK